MNDTEGACALESALCPDSEARSILGQLDQHLAKWEEGATALLIAAIFVILTGNVILRAFGAPLLWADEAAILLMACAAFLGAAVALARGQHMAVTLLSDNLPPRLRHPLAISVDLVVLGFFVVLAWLCWRWFDPIHAFGAESLTAYSQQTFNFIYQERTLTLGLQKVWFWLVLPLFAILSIVHALAALERDIRIARNDQEERGQ